MPFGHSFCFTQNVPNKTWYQRRDSAKVVRACVRVCVRNKTSFLVGCLSHRFPSIQISNCIARHMPHKQTTNTLRNTHCTYQKETRHGTRGKGTPGVGNRFHNTGGNHPRSEHQNGKGTRKIQHAHAEHDAMIGTRGEFIIIIVTMGGLL